jgi:hypothetical protein
MQIHQWIHHDFDINKFALPDSQLGLSLPGTGGLAILRGLERHEWTLLDPVPLIDWSRNIDLLASFRRMA